tara:strand:+ start:131 stop:484 length:354 start_codon:yes stop_codon:yes gene_type:complete
MKKIYKDIETAKKIYLETEKSKLEKVEFATIYDDIKGALAKANKEAVQAFELTSKAQKLIKTSISKNKELLKEFDKTEKLIKEIGLDSELNKLQKAKNQVLENIDSLDKILTNLITI